MNETNFEAIFSAVKNIHENIVVAKQDFEEMKEKLLKLENDTMELHLKNKDFEKSKSMKSELEDQKLKVQILEAENKSLEAEKESLGAEKKALVNRLNEVSLKLKLKNRQYNALVAEKQGSELNQKINVPHSLKPKNTKSKRPTSSSSADANKPKRKRSSSSTEVIYSIVISDSSFIREVAPGS